MKPNIRYLLSLIFIALHFTACNNEVYSPAVSFDKVTLQLNWVHQTEFAGYYVADAEGLYTTQQLKVKIVSGGPTIDPIAKVVAKEADFAIINGPIELLQARAAGQPVVAVAALFQRDPNVWISLADKKIMTPADLKGRRIGVKPIAMTSLQLLLAQAGMTLADVQTVPLTDPTIRPLVEGEVDVLSGMVINEPLLARRQGYAINVMSLGDQGVVLPNDLLIVHEDLWRNKPDVVKRFVQASLMGWKMTVDKPELGLSATLRLDETLNVAQQTDMLAEVTKLIQADFRPIGFMNEEMWVKIMQLALNHSLITHTMTPSQFYTTQFLLP